MWVLAMVAWVGVVLAGSGVTWFAIDRAGQQVTDGSSGLVTEPAVVSTVGAAPIGPATSAPTTSTAPTATTAPSPTRSGATPSAPASSVTKRATPRTSAPPPARTVTRTWSGTPGSVTVACTGSVGVLRGASPVDGWVVERDDHPEEEVEVKFEKSEVEIQVKASCVDGVPEFRVESDDD